MPCMHEEFDGYRRALTVSYTMQIKNAFITPLWSPERNSYLRYAAVFHQVTR